MITTHRSASFILTTKSKGAFPMSETGICKQLAELAAWSRVAEPLSAGIGDSCMYPMVVDIFTSKRDVRYVPIANQLISEYLYTLTFWTHESNRFKEQRKK